SHLRSVGITKSPPPSHHHLSYGIFSSRSLPKHTYTYLHLHLHIHTYTYILHIHKHLHRIAEVEVKLSGEGPWFLDGDGEVVSAAALTGTDGAAAGELAAPCDLTFIFTPGHTEGHVCLYYAPYKVLFSGDHLCSAWGEVEGAPQVSTATRVRQHAPVLHFTHKCWSSPRAPLRSWS
ncbi:hypothetical protein Vafri_4623, partial [Volvox africanus]